MNIHSVMWGLLDGDGTRIRLREGYRVILSTSSFAEGLLFEKYVTDKLKEDVFSRVEVEPYRIIRVIIPSLKLYDMFNEDTFWYYCVKDNLGYVTGLFYAEGWIEHRWLVSPKRVSWSIRDIRLALKPTGTRRTYERLEYALDNLGIDYRRLLKVRGVTRELEYIISSKRAISKILEYYPLNYKYFKYLMFKYDKWTNLNFDMWVTSVAVDYYYLPLMFWGCHEDNVVLYLDDVDKGILSKSGIVIPKIKGCKRLMDIAKALEVNSIGNVRVLASKIIGGNRDRWGRVIRVLIHKTPSKYWRTMLRFLNYIEKGIKVVVKPIR